MLVKHLQSGNSYGIQLKEQHTKFPQPELGPWVEGSKTVGTDYHPPVLEGWEPPGALAAHGRLVPPPGEARALRASSDGRCRRWRFRAANREDDRQCDHDDRDERIDAPARIEARMTSAVQVR